MFQKIAIDIYGPLESNSYVSKIDQGKFYIFTIIDVYSRLTKLFIIKNIDTYNVTVCLDNWIKTYQMPKTLMSDNGRQFISMGFKNYLEKNKIKHILIPEYSPFSNGIAERINRTLNEMFRFFKNRNINTILKMAEERFNFNYNSSIKDIPVEVYYNNKILSKGEASLVETNDKSIQPGNKVYVKRFGFTKKDDYLYEGPVKVLGVGSKGKWIKVEELKNYQHIKNIKIKREGRM